jgi:hypothetical protein
MKIPFACPSCLVAGSVDESAVGKLARCKHCGHKFTILAPGETEPSIYSLEEPAGGAGRVADSAMSPVPGSAFVPAPGDNPATAWRGMPTRAATEVPARGTRKRSPRGPWRPWLAWTGIAIAIATGAVALLAPSGVLIAACVVMALGGLLILVGYGVGAYGAFREDFLYGFLYLVIPLYTAYYMVTRWEDLWVYFACMTAGVGLIVLGFEMARWGGVAV